MNSVVIGTDIIAGFSLPGYVPAQDCRRAMPVKSSLRNDAPNVR